jgi:hypothetical protein
MALPSSRHKLHYQNMLSKQLLIGIGDFWLLTENK